MASTNPLCKTDKRRMGLRKGHIKAWRKKAVRLYHDGFSVDEVAAIVGRRPNQIRKLFE